MRKEKSIETPKLLIKGNIMSWEGTMIQLSNVSCVSTEPLEQIEFPKLSILLLVAGFLGLKYNPLIGILLMIGGAAWIYAWYYYNNLRKLDTILNIIMNSGNNLRFIISNKSFLDNVLGVLEQIIIDGGVGGQQNVSINISECEITGNAKVLNDLNFS